MIFTTKNREIAIFGKTLDDVKNKITNFSTVYEQYGLLGKNGALASLFGGNKDKIVLTPKLEEDFLEFQKVFNNSSKSVEVLEEEFGDINPAILNCAKGVKNGSLTFKMFKESIDKTTLSAKAGQVALKGLSIAGNMLAMWAITKGIELAAKAIDQFVNSAKYCKERVDDALKSYNSMITEIHENAKTISKISDRYAELSKHVNRLGENVSLTEDEFEEYHTITAKIAEMYPSLVDGWDSQGNAIVNLTDSLKELNAEYDNSLHNANLSLMESKDDIFKNYQNIIKDINKSLRYAETALELAQNNGDFYDYIYDDEGYKTSYYYAFKDLGLSVNDMVSNNFDTLERQLILKIQSLKNKANAAAKGVTPLLKAMLQEDLDYQELSDELQDATVFIIEQIPTSLMDKITTKGSSAGSDFIEGFVDAISTNGDVQDAILKLFTDDLTELSPIEAKQLIDGYISTIQDTFESLGYEVDIADLRINLGFNDIDNLSRSYHSVLNRAAKTINNISNGGRYDREKYANYRETYDEIDAFARQYSINTQDEIAAFQKALEDANYDIEIAFENYLQDSGFYDKDPISFSDIFSLKNAEGELNTLGQLNDQLSSIQSAYKNLSDAMDSYSSAGYITIDQFQAIVEQGSDFLDYLETEDGQLSLNEQAMYDLAEARIAEMQAQMLQGIVENVSKITDEAEADLYLASVNYELAESYQDLANSKLEAWSADALNNGLSQEYIDQVMTKAYSDIDKINALAANVSLGSKGGSIASSSAAKSMTELLDNELNALDKSMEAGYIEFSDYITARLGLIEDYYRKGRIAANEYYSYLEKHYDQQLSVMDRVVSAVTRRIDTEIDGLEKQKDSIESVYNAQIDSLEKQKTLLQEANKERERQADLQKALYELERAQQQKTKMVFTENGGMRYVTDDTAIKDAGKNVEDAKLEIQIAELDKSISKLEEARDRETAAFDERISKLKEYKDSWSDLTSAYEEEQDNLLAAQILGQEWEEDILNGRLDTLDAFKNEYISIQQAMADAAWQSANEQIKAAQEAQKGASGSGSGGTPIADTVTSSGPHTSLGNKSNIKYVAFHEYASGTDNAKKGINLVGEDGTEAYFDNHGHIALITEPTLIPMEGGEVVKNESATRKLLNPNNLAAVDTSTLAGVDSQDPIASGRLRPIQSGDRAWELQQSLIAYLAKIGSDINALLAPVNAIQRDTEQIAGANINTNQIHNANQMQQVTIGDIHVTCPGVTSQEIMNQVGEALNRQLGGIALDALQESTKR